MAVFNLTFTSTGGSNVSNQVKKLTSEIDRLTKEVDELSAKLNKNAQSAQGQAKSTKDAETSTKGLSSVMASFAGNALANVLSQLTSQLTQFATDAFRAGAQFEKFKAVIANTVGSTLIAESELARLTEFAKTTPFQLEELIDAFIKLSNRGIKPTNEVLTNFGDLAVSQGKSLDQFIEAVLDATSGELERLKEFGIRAKKNGEEVTLTFKGIEKTVKLSEVAIQGALQEFAQLQGVAGNVASAVDTTDGKISNLGDSLTSLQVQLFNELQPTLNTFTDVLSSLISEASDGGSEVNGIILSIIDVINNLQSIIGSFLGSDFITSTVNAIIGTIDQVFLGLKLITDGIVLLIQKASGLDAIATSLNAIFNPILALNRAINDAGIAFARVTGATKSYQEQLDIAKQNNKTFALEAESLSKKLTNASTEDLKAYLNVADSLGASITEQISFLEDKIRVVQEPALKKAYQEEVDKLKAIKLALGATAEEALTASEARQRAANESAKAEGEKEQQLAKEQAKAEEEEAKRIAKERAVAEKAADEQAQIKKAAADERVRIEKAAADEKEAIAQRTNQRLKILLDEQTNDLETALDSRIAKENAAIESINDQTDTLSQQLELIKLIGEQEDIIAQRRLDAINQSIDANQKQLELAQILNDEGASEEQKTLASVEARARGLNLFVSEDQLISQINAKREEARRVEAAQLATQQQRAQEELAYQQELQRLDLDRQVRQAEINAIEAERTVIQAEQLLKSQMIELSEQNRLLIQAQLNGASAAELQNIAAQIDLIQSQIDISTESVNLARESVKLSQSEVTDATELRKNYEQIATKQTENLKLQQESDRQQQRAGDVQERVDDKVQQELAKVKVKEQTAPSEPFRRSGGSALGQWQSLTGRAEGGPVSANTPYVVGEKGPELFLPNTNGNILPNNLLQTLGNLPLDRPGTFVPKVLGGLNLDSLAAEIKGLRRDLQNRPVPVVNAPTTFVNEPNPLAAQMAMLQNQLKAARAI